MPSKPKPKCQYCGNTFNRRYARDRHESKYCKVRKMQMSNLSRTPVSVEEALDLRSSMNVTNEAFDIFLKFISGKWGDESLSKGTKVNYC